MYKSEEGVEIKMETNVARYTCTDRYRLLFTRLIFTLVVSITSPSQFHTLSCEPERAAFNPFSNCSVGRARNVNSLAR